MTEVVLFDGSSSLESNDEIVVTDNQMKTLTCQTGDANPVPIIIWYIDNHMKQNETTSDFVFTPSNDDHGLRIHCKAYNIQPPDEAVVSSSPVLFVRGIFNYKFSTMFSIRVLQYSFYISFHKISI